ncbi:MAG: DUF1775 domain-containing protein [Archangium sp.]
MRRRLLPLLIVAVLVPAFAAIAHISGNATPVTANATQEIVLSVGHGCEGFDTSYIRAALPAGMSGVRAMTSDFGRATVETDGTGAPIAVNWVRDDANLIPVDTNFYKLVIRGRTPNAPFTTQFFPTEQRCKLPDGGVAISLWTDTSGMPTDAGAPEAAPQIVLVPAHKNGWNKLTVPVAVTNLALYFSDAQIVWKDSSAFSANASVASLISTTPGVTALTSLAANDEIWVKY